MTICDYKDAGVQRFFSNITTDNVGIVERKLAPKIRSNVKPQMHQHLRTNQLPSGLDAQEKKFAEREEWPRSIYIWDVLLNGCKKFESVADSEPLILEYLDVFSHPWKKSSSFARDLELPRNKRSMVKSAGLPGLSSKRNELAAAIQYVDESIKSTPVLENLYSFLSGARTQQSPPEDPKVRLVWMEPISTWLLEVEAIDSAITATVEAISDQDIFVFYTEPSKFQEWAANRWSDVVEWVNLDAEAYDTSVSATELEQLVNWFCGDYEFKELIIENLQSTQLALPNGQMSRYGGMPSGTKFTNLGDGWTNTLDIIEAFARYKLDRYIECVAVNGDDITVGLTTKLKDANLKQIATASRRNINYVKTVVGDYIWNSKLFIGETRDGELLMTRPLERVYNSLCFAERQKDSIYGSKEYIELATASILQDVEQHPCGDQFIESVANQTQFHLSSMSDEDLVPAAEAYADINSWREWDTPQVVIEHLRSTKYGMAK